MASKEFTSKLYKKPQAVSVPQETTTDSAPVEYTTRGKKKVLTKNGKYVGRPKVKTEPTKTINIAVPISVLEKLDIAKCKYHDNLTEYVNAVIVADLENNMNEYKKIYNLLNN